jgi:hypothetical protein
MTCHETAQSLGAYVLGVLDQTDRRDVDTHLLDCPECAAELSELEPLTPLLARLTIDDVGAPGVMPSDDLFSRVAAAADRAAHRRLLRLLATAATAVLVVVAGVGVGLRLTAHRPPVTFAASSGQTHMSVAITGRTSGTDLIVSIDGLPVDEQCKLVAVSRAGTWDTAGSWVATYAGTAKVTGSTTIARGQLAKLVLLGTNGRVLVTVPVSLL